MSEISSATLRFRHDQISSGVSRLGRLRPGGELHVEYDPTRLLPRDTTARAADIVCHVRFYPGGKERSGSLQVHATGAAAGPGLFETLIPPETSSVEIWFERREGADVTGWDSRYGQNYRFAVTPAGLPVPERSVELRPHALVDPTRIRVLEDTASKAHASSGTTGAALQTGLSIRARVSATSSPLTAWADIHVFDASDDLIHTGTIALQKLETPPAADEELEWHADVYQGSGGGSGAGVWFRPDAHTVQYRLYCESEDTLYTDGVLHQFDVPTDAEVRPPGTAW